MITKLKAMNWMPFLHTILLFIAAFYINFYSLNKQVMMELPGVANPFRALLSFGTKAAFMSLLIFIVYVSLNINLKFLKKVSLSYLVYIVTNYFIIITQNLNNKDFRATSFLRYDFFQVDFLKMLLLLIVPGMIVGILVGHFDRMKPFVRLFDDFKNENLLVGLLIAIAFFRTKSLLNFLIQDVPDLSIDTNFLNYLKLVSLQTVLLSLCITCTIWTLLRAFTHLRRLKPSFSLAFITSLSMAIMFNFTLQYGVRTDVDLLGHFIFPGATAFQIYILTVIFLVVYVLTNRYLASTLFLSTLGIIISIANIIKEKMRSEPLLITDLLWIREIKTVISFVDEKIILYLVIAFITPIVLYFLIKHFVDVTPIIFRKRLRFIVLISLLGALFSTFMVFKNEKDGKIQENIPIISKVNNSFNIEWMGFDASARYKSVVYVWTKQLTKKIMPEPKTYSRSKLQAISKKYKKLAAEMNQSRPHAITDQTVIYILSESLANPNRISGITTSRDLLPNIDSIKSITTSGLMHSDGYGGGTANMEFEALTGLPYYNFSPGVSTLYTEVVPKLQYFPSLSNFYPQKNRFVMHPASVSNYNRGNVYRRLGFGNMIFSEGTKENFNDTSKVGVNMSDEALYNNILEKLDTKTSQFYSIITMQNHAPWSIGSPTEVTATGNNFSELENNNLTEYARLLTYTDKSTMDFLDKLSQIEKDITVVFYGDHLPGLYPDSIFRGQEDIQYKTDYFIWSNHNNNQLNYPLVNSSDFSAELLKHTNSKVSPYYALLTKVLDEASVDKTDLNPEQKVTAEDLKLVQYDMTLGKNYLMNHGFYKIGD
ncbi:Glycerol phosphate lipoteichoic acid synthase [Streptococcus porcinus]|uniref:LTA synthase family protein n=1 Tax=Streptococcus porcinus TaxID=1340 RepID=UPI0010CAB43E|nr:alkaline phosphatase family protein [Streptococcus porcinus]VTS31570.1 Glycerol phosphate lipoteichoic acid synthase [Streptococcus porcinus]